MKSTYTIALTIAVALTLWLASGQFGADEPDAGQAADGVVREEKIQRVRTRTSRASDHVVQVVASGRMEAKRSVEVRAETSGRVIAMPVEKGAQVEEGEVLCQLSMEDRDIKYEKAKAAVEHAQLEHEGMLRLSHSGYQGDVKIASSKANLVNARAELKSRSLDLANRNVTAPFAGVVETRAVEVGDFIQRGGVCIEVIDLDPMLLVTHVSERELAGLGTGSVARAHLADGQEIDGRVSFIGHAADPVTRTFRVEIQVPNPSFTLRDGLSADVYLAKNSVKAHRVSPAILSLDDSGGIGIKVLDHRNRVNYVEVSIVSDTEEGIWLSGLPDVVRLITVGQELVFAGQEVEAVPEDQADRVASP